MSFRKRNEAVSGAAPARPERGGTRAPHPAPPAPAVGGARAAHPPPAHPAAAPADSWAHNAAVRPSAATAQPTVSTGCGDLDRVLVHQGVPLGSSLLVEESGTTDFAAVLVRAFAAQGVMHSRRAGAAARCHVVVVGAPAAWASDLPGEYKGTSREQKKAQIARERAQVSVANMAAGDMKIAWRYGLQGAKAAAAEPAGPEHYVTQFDITQRMVPAASAHEVSYVPVGAAPAAVVAHVARVVEQQAAAGKVVRVVVPGLLHPSLYAPRCSAACYVVPLLHGLRGVVASRRDTVLMASIALDLYPRESLITHMAETLMDGVVHLQPFNPDMAALVERAYKNEPAKIQHGLVHVLKIPVLSDRGMMLAAAGEYAFRNGRKKFDIDEWGIPVEDTEEPATTTTNIDF